MGTSVSIGNRDPRLAMWGMVTHHLYTWLCGRRPGGDINGTFWNQTSKG